MLLFPVLSKDSQQTQASPILEHVPLAFSMLFVVPADSATPVLQHPHPSFDQVAQPESDLERRGSNKCFDVVAAAVAAVADPARELRYIGIHLDSHYHLGR